MASKVGLKMGQNKLKSMKMMGGGQCYWCSWDGMSGKGNGKTITVSTLKFKSSKSM